MSDLRNKMKRILDDELIRQRHVEQRAREKAWAEAHPTPSCACGQVWGKGTVWQFQPDRWRPPVYFCPACLPDWAAYELGNNERLDRMCNLYSMTKSQDAIRQLTRTIRDLSGNLAPLPAIFPQDGASGARRHRR